ncbi:MAG: response regulator transcription factor [Betaproteobacteria bacterium]|nr:response regulator transcription factor [Betaproteobacteria bacterium]
MYLLVSSRDAFLARWRPPLARAGGEVVVRAALTAGGKAPMLTVVDTASLAPGWSATDPVLRAACGGGRLLLAGQEFAVESELAALAAGISGCCADTLGEDELANVVEVVLKGGIWVSRAALPQLLVRLQGLAAAREANPAVAQTVVSAGPEFERAWGQLTSREREIARQVAEGASNKAIARNLAISDATIKAHLTSVFQKLHVAGRVQLALLVSSRAGNQG